MEYRRVENFIITIISISGIGLICESILLNWEFWVPPLVAIGTVTLWYMNIMTKPDFGIRRILYLGYAMLAVFYHGVHETSIFDVSIVMILVMVIYTLFQRIFMMNLLLAEYVIIMVIQLNLAYITGSTEFDRLNISRILLHIIIVIMVYSYCIRTINEYAAMSESGILKDELLEKNDSDLEDFLSNISHELRTPVNVVNGMSDLLIKRNIGSEAYAIKDAGIRLAYQIENIQDYMECKRNKLALEEEDYMSISLVNDVVTSYNFLDNSDDLELVIDISPSVPSVMRGDIKKLRKIFRHLLENAVKFTKNGGLYVRMYSENKEYGVNLCIEMTDTGIGMDQKTIESIAGGIFQANKKSNRSAGGIGLGLFVVYGFVHKMGGFVKIESEKKSGTTVRITIPQKVADDSPCLALSKKFEGDILFHVRSDKYKVPRVREFYRSMASNLADGIHVPLYSAETIEDIERLKEKLNVTHIFMGQEEYEDNPEYFDRLSETGMAVAVSAYAGFEPNPSSRVLILPKPLYAYPVIKILNGDRLTDDPLVLDNSERPVFTGIKALVVDDEPVNLVVATGMFSDYEMSVDTAGSGSEAIEKYRNGDYDIVFMDHMMPGMDGVEAMKRIRAAAAEMKKDIIVIALTANAVSGAREMFMKEGFDGFIAKPVDRPEFERVMQQVFSDR